MGNGEEGWSWMGGWLAGNKEGMERWMMDKEMREGLHRWKKA